VDSVIPSCAIRCSAMSWPNAVGEPHASVTMATRRPSLILAPPVPADLLPGRQQASLHAYIRLWPFTSPPGWKDQDRWR
jgi:hypothetical protein